jgi:hypothetical protein
MQMVHCLICSLLETNNIIIFAYNVYILNYPIINFAYI